jgi:hypothetical protein
LINDAFHSRGSSKVREATYLGDAVHPLGEAGVVGDGGPDAGEALVDLAPEQERVRGQELIELVPFALALEDRPVLR